MTTKGTSSPPPNQADVPSPLAKVTVQTDATTDPVAEQTSEISLAHAVQSFALMEAKAKAEAAELQKRLVMQQFRPCKVYPTIIYHDGLRWVCEYASLGTEFQEYEGTDAVAYGMCPEEAMQNFDAMWVDTLSESKEEEEEETGDENV